MKQNDLNRAIALRTGESVQTIRQLGFTECNCRSRNRKRKQKVASNQLKYEAAKQRRRRKFLLKRNANK